jgi:hypothetical protein
MQGKEDFTEGDTIQKRIIRRLELGRNKAIIDSVEEREKGESQGKYCSEREK